MSAPQFLATYDEDGRRTVFTRLALGRRNTQVLGVCSHVLILSAVDVALAMYARVIKGQSVVRTCLRVFCSGHSFVECDVLHSK